MTPSFERAFNTLTHYEKADYYLGCLKVIVELNKTKEVTKEKDRPADTYTVLYRDEQDKRRWKMITIDIHYSTLMLVVEALRLKLKL